ncbi:Hsp70 family protein [Nocardia sp. SYP-A9097]|uniref:Hsp70 family protein n=1 Tax=Nocardia sp. SYP-A9097 TaxID=2663237 RepID=UPI00129A29BE|nr:Hsp70 family protein [Nocardia sp. SYP-A9097]MRH87909.1 Hsp70 family protein [Nocardia sp. SYP-A9097]
MEHRIVAAIDFGTHGTGYAWAFTSERDREPRQRSIHFFDEWAGQPSSYIKNRTALLLGPDGAPVEWGHQARRRFHTDSRTGAFEYVDQFKMDLLQDPDPDVPGTSVARRSDMSSYLVTTYLQLFFQFAVRDIVARSGVNEGEILWCLTVPAIWRDRERQIMRQCAERAGIPGDQLLLAVEPEVAALYCRHDAGLPGTDAAGDRFMVVDAGGGTVDITAYEVTDLGLTEIGYTSGGGHGSTYLDLDFISEAMVRRLGRASLDAAYDADRGAFADLLDSWERAKLSFDPTAGHALVVPLSNRLYRNLDSVARDKLGRAQNGIDDEIILDPVEAIGLFDRTVEPILDLVDDQLARIGDAGVGRILLVGGFAQSRHLQNQLRQRIGSRATLVIPSKPAWAVLIGAVHYALAPSTAIVGRRSRFTYGVSVAMKFEEGRDPEEYRTFDYANVAKSNNRFDAFVPAGEIIASGHEVRRTYLPLQDGQTAIGIKIFTSMDPEPRYVTDSGCSQVGYLTVDATDSLSLPTPDRTSEVIMTFGGTEISVRARDLKSEQDVRVTVDFVTDHSTDLERLGSAATTRTMRKRSAND